MTLLFSSRRSGPDQRLLLANNTALQMGVMREGLEREASCLSECKAGWEETRSDLERCEARLEEEGKRCSAIQGDAQASRVVLEERVESLLRDVQEARAGAERKSRLEGTHQDLLTLLAEKESIISQLTQGRGSKPADVVEPARSLREMGMEEGSASETRRNLEVACTSLVDCADVLLGAGCDHQVKHAADNVKSQVLSLVDYIHSEWGEDDEIDDGSGSTSSGSSSGGAMVRSRVPSISSRLFDLSKGLAGIAQGLASAMHLHKAEAERGQTSMLVDAVVRDMKLLGHTESKGKLPPPSKDFE